MSKIIKEFEDGTKIVGMITFKDQLFVATSWGVYRLEPISDTLVPLKFLVEEPDPAKI